VHNDLPQPQPPEREAPTKPRSNESPPNRPKLKGRRLLAAGSGFGSIVVILTRMGRILWCKTPPITQMLVR
jgi:hypothetical protein